MVTNEEARIWIARRMRMGKPVSAEAVAKRFAVSVAQGERLMGSRWTDYLKLICGECGELFATAQARGSHEGKCDGSAPEEVCESGVDAAEIEAELAARRAEEEASKPGRCPRCGGALLANWDELYCLVHGTKWEPRRPWDLTSFGVRAAEREAGRQRTRPASRMPVATVCEACGAYVRKGDEESHRWVCPAAGVPA